MLLFIDEPRHLKLVRHSPEDGTRRPIGKVRKQELELSDEIRADLQPGEAEEIAAAFALIRTGEEDRIRATVAAFPATVREVFGYYKDRASPQEQRWIVGALLEGLRVIRRHERETGA